ncbi:hypothetical protein ACIXOF_22790, partial [Bacteroides fragilis]
MENQETKTEKKIVKVKLSDAIKKASILKAVLLAYKDKELSAELKSKVMMTRIYYGKFRKQFEEDVKEAREGLKPEGYDTQLQEIDELENKARGDKDIRNLTPEMLKSALTEEEYDKHETFMPIFNKYMEEVTNFKSEKLDEEVEMEEKKFTQKEFDEILNVNTAESYNLDLCMPYNGKNMIFPG